MSEGDFEIVYNMCKNFVDVCDKDKDLKDIVFEIDSRSMSDVGDVDSSNYNLIEMIMYAESIGLEYLNIKKFFLQFLCDEMLSTFSDMEQNVIGFGDAISNIGKDYKEDFDDL